MKKVKNRSLRAARLVLVMIVNLLCAAASPTTPFPDAQPIYDPARMVAPPPSAPPVHIILFIGDGMGEAQRTIAQWSAYGQNGQLAMDAMPYHGWSHTAPLVLPVTDSAAGATAIATGSKTINGMIAMDPMFNALPTILEHARSRGLTAGLVTTTELANATPAAFATHAPLRAQMATIASQMIERRLDVLLGGGEDDFLPPSETGCFPAAGNRLDGRNLIEEARLTGSTCVCTADELAAIPPTTTRLLGLFDDAGMTRPHSPTLATMTKTAIALLDQDPEGFFLMVEGGQIDWAGHNNDAGNVIGDVLALDEAVAVAQAYAEQTANTLIIVAADHETGGLRVALTHSNRPQEDRVYTMPDGTPFYVSWSTGEHTATPIPVTAQGPQAYLLEGDYENTHIYEVMYRALFSWRIEQPVIIKYQ
ncbi:MAG: alkaline phosphatase [Anaerolineae bacterium]|nr:alkaline phosphatase [Anaerolineae bacterium]